MAKQYPIADKFNLIYRTAFASMNQGFCLLEKVEAPAGTPSDYRYLLTNPAFDQQSGLRQVAGRTVRQVVPQVDEEVIQYYDRVALGGESVHTEHYVAALDRWIEMYAFRVRAHKPLQIAVLFANITDCKKVEDALHRNEQRQEFLLTLSDALRPLYDSQMVKKVTTQLLGTYLGVNRAHYIDIQADTHTLVVGPSYVNGVSSLEGQLTVPDFREAVRAFYLDERTLIIGDTLTATDVPFSQDDLAMLEANQIRACIGVPLLKEGSLVAVLGIHQAEPRDWTDNEIALVEEVAERTWAAVERARAEEALRVAERRKDEFIAMLEHELRNPLATIANMLLLLELTGGNYDDWSYPKAVDLLSREVGYLRRMIDDLIDVGRRHQGKIKLQRTQVNLNEVVRQAVEAAQPLYRNSRRIIELTLPPSPLHVEADAVRLAQLLMKLLANGIKYTQEGGQVWVSLEQVDDAAFLRIKDDGIGITQETLSVIFEVAPQGETWSLPAHDNPGLSLTLIKQLIEEGYDGQIEAYSAGVGQGSEFRIRLPLLDTEISPGLPAHRRAQPPQSAGRVLIVDDNKDLANLTAKLIQREGYDAQVCYTGQEGIAAAQALVPDAILLDIGMPDTDGYTVCRYIRSQTWGKSILIIAVTGYGQEADEKRSRVAGFDEHLRKPINYPLLLDLLAAHYKA